jgi:hypothetical protein
VLEAAQQFGFINKAKARIMPGENCIQNGDRKMGFTYSAGADEEKTPLQLWEGLDELDGPQQGSPLQGVGG